MTRLMAEQLALPDTALLSPAFEWKLALRYLRARRKEGIVSVISLFSFLGIMLGVATLIVVMSVFNGFHKELLDKVLGFSGHATIYRSAVRTDPGCRRHQETLGHDTACLAVRLHWLKGRCMVSSVKNATGALVRGVSEEDIQEDCQPSTTKTCARPLRTPGGIDEKPGFQGWDKSEGVAIGERMAWKHQVGLGTTITLISPNGPETVMGSTPRIRDYPVVAIFKMGMSEYDENVVYMPHHRSAGFLCAGRGRDGH